MQLVWNELHVFKRKWDFCPKPKTNFLLKSLNDSNTFENDSNPFENNLNYFFKKKLILGGEKKELRKLRNSEQKT